MKTIAIIFALIIASFASSSYAEQALTPQQNERYNKIANEIRCVVCESEPVSTSSSKIAMDMRDVIKDRILKGENDKQIRTYFANHYGEYVLLRPQLSVATIALWVSPLFLLALGVFMIFGIVKPKTEPIPDETIPSDNIISDEDKAALDALKELEK